MFLSSKKPKNPNYYDPVVKKKMKQLSEMYPRNQIWRHVRKSANQVNREYTKKTNAAKKIQKFIRFMRRMNNARRLNIQNRTPNNPLWFNFVTSQMRLPLSREGKLYMSRMMPTNKNKLPKLPRNFGTWYNWGNAYVRPDQKAVYYPNLKTLSLNGKLYHGKNLNRMGLPKKWM